MAISMLPARLSFAVESTSGAGESDWDGNGTSIRFIRDSLDFQALVRDVMEDERSRLDIIGYDSKIFGLKGGGDKEFSFSAYLHGHGDTTGTDESAPTADALYTLLGNALGASSTGEHTTIVTGGGSTSTTALECDTVAGLEVGDVVGVPDSNGYLELRPIASIASTTLTLEWALSFTPAGESRVYAALNNAEDESVLEDSSDGPTTTTWLIEVGAGSTRQTWECRGCMLYLTGIELSRNTAPKLNFTVKVGSFDTPEAATVETWTGSPVGAAGLAIGPLTEVMLQNQSASARAHVNCVEFTYSSGVTPIPVPTLTENDAGMPGVGLYSLERQPPEVSLHVAPASDQYYTDFENGQLKHLAITRKAPLGSAWMLYFPRVEITEGPRAASAGNVHNTTLAMRPLKADDTVRTSPRVRIGRC